MKERLILVGGGGFGRELINWLSAGTVEGRFAFDGFIDRDETALKKYNIPLAWLGSIDDFSPKSGDKLVLGIAAPKQKEFLVNSLLNKGGKFQTLTHPTAIVAKSAVLGEGVVLCPYAIISADTNIGSFVTVNVMSTVGHDVKLGDYSSLSAHVDLTGFCDIGLRVFFGSGAKVTPNVKIGNDAVIGAGATIIRTVREGVTMFSPFAKKL